MNRKLLSILLALTMISSMCSTIAFAASTGEAAVDCEICGHIHDGDCGYTEEAEGQPCSHKHDAFCEFTGEDEGSPCTHEHTEECSQEVESCIHEHTDDCYSELEDEDEDVSSSSNAEKSEPTECSHFCSLETDCITRQLDCQHEHNEDDCGYVPAVAETGCNHEHNTECGHVAAGEGVACQHECEAEAQMTIAPPSSEGEYEVDSAEGFSEAISAIEASGETEAVIVLGKNISIVDFSGIAGKHITLKGAEDEESASIYVLTLSGNTLKLTGDVTFENVYITPKTIYAQGHNLILGEGFGGGADGGQRMIVYGGSDSDLEANTSITVLDGVYKLISGGSSKGTLTGDTYVEFGGDARFPMADEQREPGDFNSGTYNSNYNLYFEGEYIDGGLDDVGILPYGIYGGGTVGNTDGDTEIVMSGGTVFQIFGGGASRRAQQDMSDTQDLGQVTGDTSVQVTGGTVKSVYGGGYNDIYVDDGDIDTSVREYRASVGGDTFVYIGGDAVVPATEREENSSSGSDIPAVHGGSFHSSVQNTVVRIAEDAKIESGGSKYGYGVVYGGGCNDIVRGTTFVELTDSAVVGNDSNTESSVLTQGKFSAITPLGRSMFSRGYFGGNQYDYGAEIHNEASDDYAATAEVSGGTVDVLMAGIKNRKASGNKEYTVTGNVLLKQSGGTIKSIEAGCTNPQKVIINGVMDILVTGGSTTKYIMGRYPSNGNKLTAVNATFDGCGTPSAFLESPTLLMFDQVHLTNNAYTAVLKTYQGSVFYNVQNLTVVAGSNLALKDPAKINGDLAVNGTLCLSRTDAKRATLTAAGIAAGTGALLPITAPVSNMDYGIGSIPKVNEEYVYAKTKDEGSTMALTLTNSVNGLYVAQKNKAAGQDVWYIDQKPTFTLRYDANGGSGTAPAAPAEYEKDAIVTVLANTFLYENKEFTDWNTQADGNGIGDAAGTTFEMPAENVTLYAQWKSDSGGGENPDPNPDPHPTYTVTYNANGGSGTAPAAPAGYEENTAVTVLANTFVNENKEFTGWNTQADSNGIGYAAESTFTMPAANVVLYAQWQSKNTGGGGGNDGSTDSPDDTSLTVSKVWRNDVETERPDSVAVQLYKNGAATGQAVELSAANDWKYTWTNLNSDYTWSVDELSIPQGYKKAVTQNGVNHIITNTRIVLVPIIAATPENDIAVISTKPHNLPQTSDHSMAGFWLVMSVISGTGLILANKRKQ